MPDRTYLCIDLKSFYASVECVERDLNPLDANLVVADTARTTKTICLAVSPSLKAIGIPGRPRLFEVVSKVKEANYARVRKAPCHKFTGESFLASELAKHPELAINYLIAPPRMAYYIEYSTKIYNVYLKYIAPEDIHVYSIDEVFIDLTPYLGNSNLTAHQFAMLMIQDVLKETGITATAGIGTNMYLAKVAMDIVAKHIPADKDGVRIAELDEMSYRYKLWDHTPITDFWRVGQGYARRLAECGMYTMGDVALCSSGTSKNGWDENLLYQLFGVNAELLIDHAWGQEPCTIKEIKRYHPLSNSLGSGQVLHRPYKYDEGELVVKEMADELALSLVEKRLVTDQLVLSVGYDIANLEGEDEIIDDIKEDRYGRKVPRPAHGTYNLEIPTSATSLIVEGCLKLYHRLVNPDFLIRRFNIVTNHVVFEGTVKQKPIIKQIDLFNDYEAQEAKNKAQVANLEKERKVQEAMLSIKRKYGKNAVLKGMNYKEGATTKDRNEQIGGHKA